jgi:hypothetical protein
MLFVPCSPGERPDIHSSTCINSQVSVGIEAIGDIIADFEAALMTLALE